MNDALRNKLLEILSLGENIGDDTNSMAFRMGEYTKAETLIAEICAPIPMILFCPVCGTQHIDHVEYKGGEDCDTVVWNNPPHRSHLCAACGCIWRPADVPTTGVSSIATKGRIDTFDPHSPRTVIHGPDSFYWQLREIPEGEWLQMSARVRREHDVISIRSLAVTRG